MSSRSVTQISPIQVPADFDLKNGFGGESNVFFKFFLKFGRAKRPLVRTIIGMSNEKYGLKTRKLFYRAFATPPKAILMAEYNAFFDRFKNPSMPNVIVEDGFIKLLDALSDDPFYILLLFWKCTTRKALQFRRHEFINAASELGFDGFEKDDLKRKDKYFITLLDDETIFKNFFQSSVAFYFQISHNRPITAEAAKELLRATLGSPHVKQRFVGLEDYITFLDKHGPALVGFDLIDMTFEFATCCSSDLSQYHSDMAWPVFIQDYVNWITTSHRVIPPTKWKW